ncbi:MAG: hypothetical protein UY44_C0009G0005 [Candidatus Kaiserbacteria bacterium GW2011_GWA2_49_19]|uniref:Uncharacterized protein n=1 Tax=Candidatus Kaiserbacteria bacterium GW2011_GWA2_49_19 TaxID=1618669 RepID=A0A0G1Y0Q2_9BACT|nr:MAG: hypothetical protein UY44_C0009G0005 [Candidatus Kaiserbacteria bacterium GW2011_GWA2_49_19]HLD34226.1 hypothetical protein [Patescibacteria group bacterium]
MALTTLTAGELYDEIADLARDQGVSDKERWLELVEEVMDSHLSLGEMDLDDDTEGMKEILSGRWVSYKKELAEEQGEESAAAILEDEDEEDKKDKDDDDMGDGENDVV